MGICRYCQTNAGWFSDAHDYCVQKANAEREKANAESYARLQKANAERELAKKALDSFRTARPRTNVRALTFGGDVCQKLTKELDAALLAKHRGLIDKFLENRRA